MLPGARLVRLSRLRLRSASLSFSPRTALFWSGRSMSRHLVPHALVSFDFEGFAERRCPARIREPQDGIFGRRRWELRAAQVSQIDKAGRKYIVVLHPFKHRTEVRSSTAFRLKMDRLRWPELLRGLDRGVAIHHMNCFRLRLVRDGRDFARKLP